MSTPSTLIENSQSLIVRSSLGGLNTGDEQEGAMIIAGVVTDQGIRPASPTSSSIFDISQMPRERIVRRTLRQWSVHHSLTTTNWIATIPRSVANSSERVRFIQFPFCSEIEARKFCKAYSPPKLDMSTTVCGLCDRNRSARHCRNCGIVLCDSCCTRWGAKMVPKTYTTSTSTTVRVCKSCDWLSNAFCMALLRGRYQDALQLVDTGNINLRTSFADIHGEAMFPIHCAVLGGSLELVSLLVESHRCPLSVAPDPKGRLVSVQTSSGRTLVDLAMTGRPKVEILMYLVRRGLSVNDAKDPSLAPKTLEAILKSGLAIDGVLGANAEKQEAVNWIECEKSMTDESNLDDACNLCCERPMDCVLTPCGHQICCTECAGQLVACPICKVDCSHLRIFRQ